MASFRDLIWVNIFPQLLAPEDSVLSCACGNLAQRAIEVLLRNTRWQNGSNPFDDRSAESIIVSGLVDRVRVSWNLSRGHGVRNMQQKKSSCCGVVDSGSLDELTTSRALYVPMLWANLYGLLNSGVRKGFGLQICTWGSFRLFKRGTLSSFVPHADVTRCRCVGTLVFIPYVGT